MASESGPIELEIKFCIVQAINPDSANPTLSMWVRGGLIITKLLDEEDKKTQKAEFKEEDGIVEPKRK